MCDAIEGVRRPYCPEFISEALVGFLRAKNFLDKNLNF
jgi:hypothetical protein